MSFMTGSAWASVAGSVALSLFYEQKDYRLQWKYIGKQALGTVASMVARDTFFPTVDGILAGFIPNSLSGIYAMFARHFGMGIAYSFLAPILHVRENGFANFAGNSDLIRGGACSFIGNYFGPTVSSGLAGSTVLGDGGLYF